MNETLKHELDSINAEELKQAVIPILLQGGNAVIKINKEERDKGISVFEEHMRRRRNIRILITE